MNIRSLGKRTIGTKLLLTLLPAWLALTPHSVLAHDAAGGAATSAPNINIVNAWTDIETTSAFLAGHTHYCTVVGSADARFVQDDAIGRDPDIADNCRYEFGLQLDGGGIPASVRRTVELNDNFRVDDPNWIAVSNTRFFRVPAGFHTFRWRARKMPGTPAACAAESDDASMTVNCFQRRLSGFVPIPVGPTGLESAN